MIANVNKQISLKNRITALLSKCVYSPYYVVVFGVITFLSYLLNAQFIGFFCFAVVACFVFVLLDDVWPILPLLAFVTFLFRSLDFSNPIFIAMLIPVGICLILHFFLFPIKKFKGGYLFLPISLVTIALFTGGLFTREIIDYPKGLVTAITIGPAILFIYWFFRQFINPPKNFDYRKEFFRTLLACGIAVCIEIIFHFYHTRILDDGIFALAHMGWANSNSASVIVMISAPACFYFMIKDKVILPNLLLLAFFNCVILISKSDACAAILLIFSLILLIGTFIHLKAKKLRIALLIECFALLVIAVIVLLINVELIKAVIEKFVESSKDDTGRSDLYREAWRLFVNAPVFGVSLGYYNDAFAMDKLALTTTYFFHSTLFQVLASTGMVGLTAYVYYFVQRYRILTNDCNLFNAMCFVSFSLFEIYGFIDVVEFSIIPHMIFATLIIVITEISNLNKHELAIKDKHLSPKKMTKTWI